MARTEETASAEMNLFKLCRVVTEEDAVKTKDEIQRNQSSKPNAMTFHINTSFRGVRRSALLSYVTFLLLATLALQTSCRKETTPSTEDIVCQTAEGYYRHLVEGRYGDFAQGMAPTDLGTGYAHSADSLPEAYLRQMTDVAAHYAHEQVLQHGGMAGVRATGADFDEDSLHATAYLELHFCDSTVEIIHVSMLHTPQGWKME